MARAGANLGWFRLRAQKEKIKAPLAQCEIQTQMQKNSWMIERCMKLYYVRKYEEFRGPFEHMAPVRPPSAMWAAKFKCRRIHKWLNVMKLYYVSLTFLNFHQKKKTYEKFRGPFEHVLCGPPFKSSGYVTRLVN